MTTLTASLITKLDNGDSPGTLSGLGTAIEAGYTTTAAAATAALTPVSVSAEKAIKCVKAQYSFATMGGSIGDITLKDSLNQTVTIPINAIVLGAMIDVTTACTSGGAATIAIKTEGAGDIKGATAVASFSLNARLDGVPSFNAASSIKMTAARDVKATIATAALTAGLFNVYIYYIV